MKKLLVALTLAILLFARTTQAECSSNQASLEMSEIQVVPSEWNKSKGFVIIFLMDEEGNPVCKESVSITTVRNQAFEANEDEILPDDIFPLEEITNEDGKAVFSIQSKGDLDVEMVMIVSANELVVSEVPPSDDQN